MDTLPLTLIPSPHGGEGKYNYIIAKVGPGSV